MRGLAALAVVVAGVLGTAPAGAEDRDLTLTVGGQPRTYRLHLPPRARERGPLPVVVAFHGGGGNAAGFKAYAGLDALADREGFVVVYPDGSGRLGRRLLTWNAGTCCGAAAAQNVDDVGFVLALLRDLARDLPLDPARVYATGHSNGAMMAYRLAIEAA
ncbi:MAG: alpha/beta fold hydrolase, partial [Candidatus Rokubacteria bacterium]|nr:alpha/beta fold hydrolase [Candidatus Rokubacteria bacterium]